MKNVEIIDLATYDNKHSIDKCEVCIIGAGAAGIYLAVSLASKGIDTILLEAGGLESVNSRSIGFEYDFEKELYSGATKGRFFGLGGTTAYWGGLLVPHTRYDIKNGDASNIWRYIVDVVDSKSAIVLKKLGWNRGGEFLSFNNSKSRQHQKLLKTFRIDLMQDLSLPFRKKNFSHLLEKLPESSFKLKVFINSVACSWKCSDGGKVQSVEIRHCNDKKFEIKADKFVISAGAIESARILLELNGHFKGSGIKSTAAIGRYLTDHISLPVAKVDESSLEEVVEKFSPHFSHGWMRSYRFIDYTSNSKIPRSFFHFIFNNKSTGFFVAKEILTAMQRRRLPMVSVSDSLTGVVDIIKLGIYRYLHFKLHIPKNTEVYLQLDIEQKPNRGNCITLGNELDRFGRCKINIKWEISEDDIKNAKVSSEKFLQKWSLFQNIKLNVVSDNKNGEKLYDAYHPVGTCCMGSDKESVVDENLKVHGTKNLWVLSTGVLPSAGTANPTFTMLCLAEKLLDNIVSEGFEVE